MRTGRRFAATLLALGLTAAGCGGDESADAARELRRRQAGEGLEIKVADGGRVAGNVAEIEVAGAGIRLVEPDGDTSGKTAHVVVFVDRPPVAFGQEIPEDRDVLRSTEPEVTITGLGAGTHQVAAVLADGNQRRIGETVAEATLQVSGPTVHASVPATVKQGEPVIVTLEATGVTIMGPTGVASDASGHFDVFVDREPTAEDKVVPTEVGIVHTGDRLVRIDDLPAGEHEVWVVLSKGDHLPFAPRIADKVTFEVT